MATNLYYHFDCEGYSELLYKVFSDRDISDEAINKLLVEVENTTNNVLSFEEEVSCDYEMVTCLSEECNAEINELLSNTFLDIYFVNGNIKNIVAVMLLMLVMLFLNWQKEVILVLVF